MVTQNCKFLIIVLTIMACTLNVNVIAMEEKQQEETNVVVPEEKQKEANKEIKLEWKEPAPTKYNPKRLMTQAGMAFISSFLNTLNEAEREEFRATYNDIVPSSMISEYLDEQKEKEQTLLAQYENLPEEVKEIMTQIIDAPITRTDETLLHQAQTLSEVEKLLFLGADIRISSDLEQEPFTAALARGNIKVARKILETLREKNYKIFLDYDITGFTDLEYAIIADAPDFVITILENPRDASFYPENLNYTQGSYPGVTPLILAALYSPQSIKPLLAKGANVSLEDLRGRNAFLLASHSQSIDILKTLAQHNPEIAKKIDQDGNSALFYAASGNNTQVIRYLIKEVNLNPNHTNNILNTALTVPLEGLKKNPEYKNVIFELLKYGANPNKTLTTSLSFVIPNNYYNTEFLKQYINAGAQVNYLMKRNPLPEETNVTYLYPLASAIFNALPNATYGAIREDLNYDIIGFLIDKGAKITQEHKDQIMHSGNVIFLLIENVPVFTQEELESS